VEQKKLVIKIKVASSNNNNNNIPRSKCEENHKHNQSYKDKRQILEKAKNQYLLENANKCPNGT